MPVGQRCRGHGVHGQLGVGGNLGQEQDRREIERDEAGQAVIYNLSANNLFIL
jgi:hypothetical protein